MKAVMCRELTGVENLSLETLAVPQPASDEILVRVKAASLNFFDTLITRGKYQYKPDLPFSPGGEIAGEIISLGHDVQSNNEAEFQTGQSVMSYVGWGGLAEYMVLKPDQLIALPPDFPLDIAATLNITYGTAIYGLKDRGKLQPGERLVVLGAAGGAGLAAVEIGKLMGAEVIAVASTLEKCEICRAHGADHTLSASGDELKQALKDLGSELGRELGKERGRGDGIDVVYDCVGGDDSEAALRAMAWCGRFLVVGFASGDIPKIALNLPLLKSCDIAGVFWGAFTQRQPEAHRANMRQVIEWVTSGALTPYIDQKYALDETIEALRQIAGRQARGKLVVEL